MTSADTGAATGAELGGGPFPVRPRRRRRARSDALQILLLHREFTVIVGIVIAFVYFAVTAHDEGFLTVTAANNYVTVAAEIGIIAAPVTLLMIAGEFDLTVGSMVGASEVILALGIIKLHWDLLASLLLALAFAIGVGATVSALIVKSKLPSFIVTLAALFMLLGAAQGVALAKMGNTLIPGEVEAVHGQWLLAAFDSSVLGMPAGLWWWLGVTVVAIWVLDHTKFGNWIYACGGGLDAARRAGVPVFRLKMLLFASSGACAVIVGCLNMMQVDQAQATDGQDLVFEVVTVAVIGGALITGGMGSPLGAALAALLFGIVSQGFFFTSIPQEWYDAFVGAMLIAAVVVNRYSGQLTERIWLRRLRREKSS
jgi:simple sugar transport system permease protein